jgi:hypothetical protein
VAFETFEKQRLSSTTEPAVTLQKKGAFSLNASAFDALGRPDAVELLYDRDERLIGMRPALPENPNSYPVRPVAAGSRTYVVAGMAFAKYYGIELGVARRWAGQVRNGMLVLDLKEAGTSIAAGRPASRQQILERSPEYG